MKFSITLRGTTYRFASTKDVLAKANEEKSGDQLAGIAATTYQERIAAKYLLSQWTLADIRENPLIPPEHDEVSAVIEQAVDSSVYRQWANKSIAELREWLIHPQTTGADILQASRGWTSEVIAAVTKIMSNLDLIHVANKIEVITTCRTSIGYRGTLSSRLQPNHPSDDVQGILASIYEGLSFGSGDAVIGINPVTDTVMKTKQLLQATRDVIQKWNIPTQNCVLAHITTQMKAIKAGAPADLLFQSLAGTQTGNESFGISTSMMDEAYAMAQETSGQNYGPHRMYFETGQGSELSADAHHGVDQVTLEARCYGYAKRWKPFLVNTVVGFIGPEYLYDHKQVIRAGLEDHFMGKLHGLPMGVDVCYTNHMVADQNDMENMGLLLTAAGVQFLIAVPMGDDCMLNYQSLSYHDIAALRQTTGKQPAPEFARWLEGMGLMRDGRVTDRAGDWRVFLTKGGARR